MNSQEPRPVGLTVLQTEGQHGAVVVAFEDQLAQRMKDQAFDSAVTGGVVCAMALLAVFVITGAVLRTVRFIRTTVIDLSFIAAWRRMKRRMESRGEDQALGIGGNP